MKWRVCERNPRKIYLEYIDVAIAWTYVRGYRTRSAARQALRDLNKPPKLFWDEYTSSDRVP